MTERKYAEFTGVENEMKLAEAACAEKNFDAALHIYDEVLQHIPVHPGIVGQVAAILTHMGLPGVGVALFTLALTKLGDVPEMWANLAAALRECHLYEEAIEVGTKAAEMHTEENQSLQSCLSNLAGAWINQGNPNPGIVAGRRALRIARKLGIDNPATESNLGILLLEAGRWSEAWEPFRRRLEIRKYGFKPRSYPGVQWDGKSKARHLVVHGEQGIGDEIMFLGLVEDILPFADHLTLEVAPPLETLIRRSFPTCDVIASPEDLKPDPVPDFWIAMGDCPKFFRKGTPPKRSGYIKPDPWRIDYWRNFFKKETSEQITLLAFHGGTRKTHEELRNPPLAAWEPVILQARQKGQIFSIQYGSLGAKEAEALGIEHLSLVAGDMEETAACLMAADCLVSVQQTALHMAGGVGKRCLGAIPSRPAWRYGVNERMPWYQTVKLFRAERDLKNNKQDDWGPVMSRIAREL